MENYYKNFFLFMTCILAFGVYNEITLPIIYPTIVMNVGAHLPALKFSELYVQASLFNLPWFMPNVFMLAGGTLFGVMSLDELASKRPGYKPPWFLQLMMNLTDKNKKKRSIGEVCFKLYRDIADVLERAYHNE